ncbi:MAG: TRAP transporter small permease subunit [Clostridiales bacterium]|nr:TRAP transporter small permease subunit [Clostridiales bacterium]
MKSIEKTLFWKSISWVQRTVLGIASICIMMIVVINVFARYVLNIGIFGLEEMIVIIAMWMYWTGGIVATAENQHIKGDMLDMFIKSKNVKKTIGLVAHSLTVAALALFAWWGVEWGLWNLQMGQRTPGLRWLMIWSQIPLVISFVMMFLYSVYHLIRAIFPMKEDNFTKEVTE